MKRIALISLATAILATPAMAQQPNADSNSQSYSGAVVNVQGDTVYGGGKVKQRIDSTASGIAPGLTAAGVHSCAGSASIGVGATGFNFGAGTTYEMQECNRRAYAATLMGMGMKGAALALVCNNPEVQQALNLTGVICPQQQVTQSRLRAAPAAYASAQAQSAFRSAGPANPSAPPFCFNPATYNPSLCAGMSSPR